MIDKERRDEVAGRIVKLIELTGRSTEDLAQKALVPLISFERAQFGYDIAEKELERIESWLHRFDVGAAGSALRLVREAAGFDLHDVAETTGLSQYSISKWERGVRSPRLEPLLQLHTLYSETFPGLLLEWLARNDLERVRKFLEERD